MDAVYDIGQRIMTPKGEAIVIARPWNERVHTDLGLFAIFETGPWLDVDAITASPESLEEWLESSGPREAFGERIRAESRICKCDYGRGGCCHHLVHVDESGVEVTRFPHSVISTDCRCVLLECKCVNS